MGPSVLNYERRLGCIDLQALRKLEVQVAKEKQAADLLSIWFFQGSKWEVSFFGYTPPINPFSIRSVPGTFFCLFFFLGVSLARKPRENP